MVKKLVKRHLKQNKMDNIAQHQGILVGGESESNTSANNSTKLGNEPSESARFQKLIDTLSENVSKLKDELNNHVLNLNTEISNNRVDIQTTKIGTTRTNGLLIGVITALAGAGLTAIILILGMVIDITRENKNFNITTNQYIEISDKLHEIEKVNDRFSEKFERLHGRVSKIERE